MHIDLTASRPTPNPTNLSYLHLLTHMFLCFLCVHICKKFLCFFVILYFLITDVPLTCSIYLDNEMCSS